MRANNVLSKVEFITPEMAAMWLERNCKNRPVSAGQVERYARDMAAGNWMITNQGIGFDVDGALIDGQHRLNAIIRAGVGIHMQVTRGLPPMARRHVDQGYQRDIAGVLHMDGMPNSKHVVARVRAIANIVAKTKVVLSLSQWERTYREFKAGIDWAMEVIPPSPKTRAFSKSTVAGAFAFAYVEPYREIIDGFAKSVISSDGLRAGGVGHLLNQYLVFSALDEGSRRRRAGSYDPADTVIRKTLRACHAAVTGESITKLQDGMYGIDYFRAIHEAQGRTLPFLRTSDDTEAGS